MAGRRYYAILSGEHQGLARAELRAVLDVEAAGYRILALFEGAALFEAELGSPSRVVDRGAWIREVGLLVGVGEATKPGLLAALSGLESVLEDAGLDPGEGLRVEVDRFKGYSRDSISRDSVLSLALDFLGKAGVAASPRAPVTLRIYLTEGVALAGLALYRAKPGRFLGRMPRRRPFFKPGPLSPQLSRVMVNLSRVRPGHAFLDPFCGTGGFCIEACMVGASRVVCLDIDAAMALGALANLSWAGCLPLVARADASMPPLSLDSVDSVSTDPPYGRSTTTGGRRYGDLVESTLSAIVDSVRRGGYIVYAGPHRERPHVIAESLGLRVVERHQMYVHSTLTREIVVARRP
ncbi:MAG: RsmD family RNA methyltransferase [Desulfurococcales archaeon]|nr:RsmD family RNA methyltransferase [Desulfurococcales archaeon]